jgi:hypothetical protein
VTRPKADEDGWLTDPISRDRVIAEAVVRGMRNIELLLRGIRDDAITAYREVHEEIREVRDNVERDRWRTQTLLEIIAESPSVDPALRARAAEALPQSAKMRFTPCPNHSCALPSGHTDPHRPRVARGNHV